MLSQTNAETFEESKIKSSLSSRMWRFGQRHKMNVGVRCGENLISFLSSFSDIPEPLV